MKIGLYIALICGVVASATIFFQAPLFPSLIFPIIIGMVGIIATLWTLPQSDISPMLKLGGIMINLFPVVAGIFQLMNG
ncbi:hypothetical protein JGZ26_03290 [Staphylococcus pseudintermedius]|uniref:hypothetical protein n=1 Tax=Staphylococcus pseudintermedius TaxID=283734 RepID=UPI001A186EFA|nr:hypothetical protein [Staphylococcus pseudintermedius]MBJ8260392.1 hypothetical protein [Staphylococcus pseudintermedius]MDT0975188.1 hypothetical protein [Staphylococcus pseudintermedius]UAS07822.2 hypothetical protein K9E67_03425 [Staphylococcus pseudintermedius]UAS52250.2 hypothetical protein K9E65_10445 [Staphylococcus pseudintermedius]UAS83237.1 hypothetical protein K9E75_03405 [Staphylococcus pseudintermedius]